MTIRPIRELGDPVLRTPADEVRAFDRELAALVRDLLDTVDHPGRGGGGGPPAPDGVGIPGGLVRRHRDPAVVVRRPVAALRRCFAVTHPGSGRVREEHDE